jgi:hypothetical protein
MYKGNYGKGVQIITDALSKKVFRRATQQQPCQNNDVYVAPKNNNGKKYRRRRHENQHIRHIKHKAAETKLART